MKKSGFAFFFTLREKLVSKGVIEGTKVQRFKPNMYFIIIFCTFWGTVGWHFAPSLEKVYTVDYMIDYYEKNNPK